MAYHNLQPWQRRVYRSRGWEKVRQLVYEKQNGMCKDCGRALLLHGERKDRPNIMEFHHREPLTELNSTDPSIAFGLGNVDGLCHDCHEERHSRMGTYGGGNRRGVWFDADGMPHEG